MRVTDAIEEAARLGRRLAEIDEELRNPNTSDFDREALEAERITVVRLLSIMNSMEE